MQMQLTRPLPSHRKSFAKARHPPRAAPSQEGLSQSRGIPLGSSQNSALTSPLPQLALSRQHPRFSHAQAAQFAGFQAQAPLCFFAFAAAASCLRPRPVLPCHTPKFAHPHSPPAQPLAFAPPPPRRPLAVLPAAQNAYPQAPKAKVTSNHGFSIRLFQAAQCIAQALVPAFLRSRGRTALFPAQPHPPQTQSCRTWAQAPRLGHLTCAALSACAAAHTCLFPSPAKPALNGRRGAAGSSPLQPHQ